MDGLPVLYSFRRCPYAMRARLALAASKTTVLLREVLLRDKPAALLKASPKATVPVLVLPNGKVIDESLEIMRWALDAGDPLAWLTHDIADVQAQLALCDGPFKQALDHCKYPERYPDVDHDASWRAAQSCLERWEARLLHGQLCGTTGSLADAAIFPFVRQFAAIDPARWAALPLPRLQKWLAGWLASSLFASAMEKHPPWREGDAPVQLVSTRAGGAQAAT